MFTTFHVTKLRKSSSTNGPKRIQVQRACDWCKLTRTKCDNRRPCSTCEQAGHQCVTNGQNQFRSIAAAVKEIERLRAQIRDLECSMMRPRSLLTEQRRGSLAECYTARPASPPDGVLVNALHYGISSLPYFLKRMGPLLEATLNHPQPDIASQTSGVSSPVLPLPGSVACNYLQRSQENYFLELFWQTHYFSYPIIDELNFRKQYQSLWADQPSGTLRQPSPLVDIVLALCVQLGTSFIPHTGEASTLVSKAPPSCSTLAGFQYFQRCQTQLAGAIENPSITTAQCYIFSTLYLCEAGLLNSAQIMTVKAVMTATILGLNNEPQSNEPETQKEMTRRTWWSLYILDTQLGIELGRPFMTLPSHSSCNLPSDSLEIAHSLGPHYMYDDSGTIWLGFQIYTLRLLDTVRTISSTFYNTYNAILRTSNVKNFYNNGTTREDCARFLKDQMKKMDAWVKQVPTSYRIPRKGGESFSIDRAPLELNQDVPIHHQYQRLLLELLYHFHALTLWRPFICVTPNPEVSTPLSDHAATSSLNHAIALTNIIFQALATSEILRGTGQIFRWQKSALFTMLGFAYTYPIIHYAARRKAINTAIEVMERYRDVLPEASHVAAIARNLADNVDDILSISRSSSSSSSQPTEIVMAESSDSSRNIGGCSSPSTPPCVSEENDFSSQVLVPDRLPDLQRASGAADWGEIHALWAGLESVAGSSEPWDAFKDAVTLYEGEMEDLNDCLVYSASS